MLWHSVTQSAVYFTVTNCPTPEPGGTLFYSVIGTGYDLYGLTSDYAPMSNGVQSIWVGNGSMELTQWYIDPNADTAPLWFHRDFPYPYEDLHTSPHDFAGNLYEGFDYGPANPTNILFDEHWGTNAPTMHVYPIHARKKDGTGSIIVKFIKRNDQ